LCFGSRNTTAPIISGVSFEREKLTWVPGHSGVEGNNNAEALTKSATINIDRQMPSRAVPHTGLIAIIKSSVRKEWQRYLAFPKHQGNKLRDIKPDESWANSAVQCTHSW